MERVRSRLNKEAFKIKLSNIPNIFKNIRELLRGNDQDRDFVANPSRREFLKNTVKYGVALTGSLLAVELTKAHSQRIDFADPEGEAETLTVTYQEPGSTRTRQVTALVHWRGDYQTQFFKYNATGGGIRDMLPFTEDRVLAAVVAEGEIPVIEGSDQNPNLVMWQLRPEHFQSLTAVAESRDRHIEYDLRARGERVMIINFGSGLWSRAHLPRWGVIKLAN
ncbi:MAG: hypothetical protein PVJ09_04280 [Candidatus Woesebacteria bacterium]|jgi:hypothetical protein